MACLGLGFGGLELAHLPRAPASKEASSPWAFAGLLCKLSVFSSFYF